MGRPMRGEPQRHCGDAGRQRQAPQGGSEHSTRDTTGRLPTSGQRRLLSKTCWDSSAHENDPPDRSGMIT